MLTNGPDFLRQFLRPKSFYLKQILLFEPPTPFEFDSEIICKKTEAELRKIETNLKCYDKEPKTFESLGTQTEERKMLLKIDNNGEITKKRY